MCVFKCVSFFLFVTIEVIDQLRVAENQKRIHSELMLQVHDEMVKLPECIV